jgi:hypothetical protein
MKKGVKNGVTGSNNPSGKPAKIEKDSMCSR